MSWRLANDPPKGQKNKWSKKVVALTNYRNVFMLSHYRGDDDSCWQRLSAFEKGEKVTWWKYPPPLTIPEFMNSLRKDSKDCEAGA